MKLKPISQSSIKGVALSVLAPGGKSDPSWLEGLVKRGCKIHQVDNLKDLIKRSITVPTKAMIIEIDYGEALKEFWENNPDELAALNAETIFLAPESKTEEASAWAKHFNGYFITTPVSLELLTTILERALEANLLKTQLEHFQSDDPTVEQFGSILAKSPEMKDVLRLARILSLRDDPILFVGGIGAGKESIARTIHENSERRHGPFFAINCRSFGQEDLAIELFGRGEPDSKEAGEGKTIIELCESGSLFLDEIGVISPNVQGKLQRLLEEGTYTRVNSRTQSQADVRIFAATSTPLDEAVARGDFSEDLFFRLNRFTLHIPSLRRRVEDIPVLTRHILKIISQQKNEAMYRVAGETLKMLMEYHWPGNVRELENVLEFASLVAGGNPIEPKHLPKQFKEEMGSIFVGSSVDDLPPMSEIERRYILRVMEATRGNKVKAAQILDINRATLHRKLQTYEEQKLSNLG